MKGGLSYYYKIGCPKIVLDSASAGRLDEAFRISSRHSLLYCRRLCSCV